MKHQVLEQILSAAAVSTKAVSSVKTIALASAEAQWVFTINADHVDAAYASIQITTDQINFNGRIGEGRSENL